MDSGYRPLDDDNFDYDPVTGVRQRLVIDGDGKMHFVSTQNVEDITKYAHEQRGSHSKFERLGDVAKVGSIPMLVMYDLIRRGIWNDPERRKQWWNSVEAAPYHLRENFRF